MGQGQAKTSPKTVPRNAPSSSSVDKENSAPEPIFGSPIEKSEEFPVIPEDKEEEAPERRIAIAGIGTYPIKTPSPEPIPQSPEKRKEVPFVFRWNYGGNEVYLAGDFNDWQKNIPLSKSQGDFTGMLYVLCTVPLQSSCVFCFSIAMKVLPYIP